MGKIYKVLTLTIALTTFTGCGDDFLEITPQGSINTESFYKTEEEVEQALFATYDVLGHQKGVGLPYAPVILISVMLSDDEDAGGQDAGDGFDENDLNTFNIPTGNQIVRSLWKRNYWGIYRANFTLEKLGELENASAAFSTRIEAEAKFLRAYFHFELVSLFENVPVMTFAPKGIEASIIAQSTPTETYNQIASDLIDAIAGLPTSVTGSDLGRATTWAAKSLLGRVFLFRDGVYNQNMEANGTTIDAAYVLAELEDVINNSGHDLLPDYATVFSNAGEFSVESVFEISYSDNPPRWEWGNEERVEGNLAAQMMGPRALQENTHYRGWAFGTVSHKLYQDMTGDPRRDLTILHESNIGGTVNKTFQHTGYYSNKYSTDLEAKGTSGQLEHNNTTNERIIRFSDVLLMAAELGQNVNYINRVRQRVGLGDLASYTENSLFNERRMELSLEGLRYFDLLRQGITVAEAELTVQGVRGPEYIDDQALYDVTFNPATKGFLPIPQDEIDLSNGVLIQNEGY
ncbi:MAG: RagB/SusD family nutrient uptake outer membrane protein [Ekhidna sp.]